MLPLFTKGHHPNSIPSADIPFICIYLPWKENTIFSLPLFSFHIYSCQSDKVDTESKPQASLASSPC